MFVPILGRPAARSVYRSGPCEQLAHDEQRPPLADEPERVGDRAVLVVALHLAFPDSPSLHIVKNKLAKRK